MKQYQNASTHCKSLCALRPKARLGKVQISSHRRCIRRLRESSDLYSVKFTTYFITASVYFGKVSSTNDVLVDVLVTESARANQFVVEPSVSAANTLGSTLKVSRRWSPWVVIRVGFWRS